MSASGKMVLSLVYTAQVVMYWVSSKISMLELDLSWSLSKSKAQFFQSTGSVLRLAKVERLALLSDLSTFSALKVTYLVMLRTNVFLSPVTVYTGTV